MRKNSVAARHVGGVPTEGNESMSTARKRPTARVTPSYCPTCQRLYRRTPANYLCRHDQTPLIDVNDPLPAKAPSGFVLGAAAVAIVFVGIGVTIV